jgi:polyisoprenoid-binding protein YceI
MCVAALAHAAGYKKAADSKDNITFHATAGGGNIDIKGRVPRLTVAQTEGAHLVLKADMRSINFGNGSMDKMRYNHAKKELKFEQHPEVILRVKADSVSVGGKKSGKGQLTFHGVTKPVDFTYTAKETGNAVAVDGNFTINLPKHGIKEPICKLEICVADNVKVAASFTLDKQP